MGEKELELYNPFRKMKKFEREMDKYFSDWKPFDFEGFGKLNARMPLVNVKDKENKVVVEAEMPGVNKKDIKVNVDEHFLSISAKESKRTEKKSKGTYYSEASSQNFFRRLPLPKEVLPKKAKYEYRNGVLEIEIPKANAGKGKKR